jgi:hypothetical protein
MDKIIKVQKIMLKKLLFKKLYENTNIIYHLNNLINNENDNSSLFQNSNNERYDILTNYIHKKEILQSLTILFNLLYRYYPVDILISKKTTVKQFLVSYLFVGFPEISLNNKISEREKDMYIYSKEMHNRLNILLTNMNNENLRKWIKSLNQYNNVLILFMYEDKIKKINEISLKWLELYHVLDEISKSSKYNPEEKNNIINTLKDEIIINELIINQLLPSFQIKNLYHLKYISNVSKTVIHNYFWNMVTEKIQKNEYDIVLNLFNDIKKEISYITSSNNIINELNTIIDIEYIKQLLEHNCFNLPDIINISNNTINIIKKLASINHSKIIDEKWKTIINNINTLNVTTFHEIGKIIFKFILTEIDQIKKDIFELSIIQSIGLNPLNFNLSKKL